MLRVYNTMTRRVEPFRPIEEGKVGLYTCGPTVYNYAHIGNLRTYVFEDVLRRALALEGYEVHHVMNVTDVGHLVSDADTGEDKMEKGARREGRSVEDIAEFYLDAFKKDMERLNLLMPDVWCKATEHIPEQIELVRRLEERGFTYVIDDGVYFDTSKFPEYGKLARLDVEGLQAGARIEMVEGKRRPTDFALWKFSPKDQKRLMEWESPWGIGFPGWHVECSRCRRLSLRHSERAPHPDFQKIRSPRQPGGRRDRQDVGRASLFRWPQVFDRRVRRATPHCPKRHSLGSPLGQRRFPPEPRSHRTEGWRGGVQRRPPLFRTPRNVAWLQASPRGVPWQRREPRPRAMPLLEVSPHP